MQRKNLKYLLPLVVGALVVLGFKWFGPEEEKEAVIFSLVRDALTNVHLQPKEVDDALSEQVYENYLNTLDYNKLFLTQNEVAQLAGYKKELDNLFQLGDTRFFTLSYGLITYAIDASEEIYTQLLSEPFDYTVDERIGNNPESRTFAQNKEEHVEFWRKHLKWRVLNRIYEKDRAQKEDAETEFYSLENDFQGGNR